VYVFQWPVAMQVPAAEQETEVRLAPLPAAATSGVGPDQVPPEYVYTPSLLLAARQKLLVAQETEVRPPPSSSWAWDQVPPEYL
jgi:hypothetical protein